MDTFLNSTELWIKVKGGLVKKRIDNTWKKKKTV